MKRWLSVFILALGSRCYAQVAALPVQSCQSGATQAQVSGMASTNYLQGVVPSCTVTIYLTGTTTPATYYFSQGGSPQTGPFTASPTGQWLAYTATNVGYDVVLSGGICPNCYTAPVTITGVYPGQQAGSSGTVSGQLSGTIPLNTNGVSTAINAASALSQTGSGAGSTVTAAGGLAVAGTVAAFSVLPASLDGQGNRYPDQDSGGGAVSIGILADLATYCNSSCTLNIANNHSNVSQTIAASIVQTKNNVTFWGKGLYDSNLAVPNTTPEYIMLDESTGGFVTRSNRWGINWFGFNLYAGTWTLPCVMLNSDSSYDAFSSVQSCGNNGYQTSPTGFSSHHLWLSNIILSSSSGSGRYYSGAAPSGGSDPSTAGANDWTSLGNLINFNKRYGDESLNYGRSQQNMIASIGDHFESNNLGAYRYTWQNGINHISDYFLNNNAILADQTRNNLHLGNMFAGSDLWDGAGIYNAAAWNNYQLQIGLPDNAGSGALRNKFPGYLEQYMTTSEVADWDMSAATTAAWTVGGGATLKKTTYGNQSAGMQMLRISAVSGGTASQVVTDTTTQPTGSHSFRVTYWSGDETGTTASNCEVIISNGGGTLVDSGALPSWGSAASGTTTRNDQSWETTFQNVGYSTYTITFKTNAATSCYFTDVRSVQNYLANPSFEIGTVGSTPTSWTNTAGLGVISTAQAHTGSNSMLISTTGSQSAETHQLLATVTPGAYYEASAWMYQCGLQVSFALGAANSGTQEDGIYSGIGFKGTPYETGIWHKVSYTFQAFATSQEISFGGLTSGSSYCGYVDDLSVVQLHLNQQNAVDDFAKVNTAALTTTAATISAPNLTTGCLQNTAGTVNGTGSVCPVAPVVTTAGGDLLCAHAGDTSIGSIAITGGTSTTLVFGSFPGAFYLPGVQIGVTGATSSGGTLNGGPYTVTTYNAGANTLTFASLPGTWTSGGTAFLYCANQVTDAISSAQYFGNNTYTFTPAANATITEKFQLAYWSPATAPTINGLGWELGSINIYASTNTFAQSTGANGKSAEVSFDLTGLSTTRVIATLGSATWYAGTTGAYGGGVTVGVTAGAQPLKLGLYYAATGLGGITSGSGGTISGTGTCTLGTFNNGLTSGAATVTFSTSGSWTGATFTVTNTGYGASSTPTSATLSSGTATCSGSATLVTVLGGAQGNAVLLEAEITQ